jgi:hypothetical protein
MSFGPKNAILVVLLSSVSIIRSTAKSGSLSDGPPTAARALALRIAGGAGVLRLFLPGIGIMVVVLVLVLAERGIERKGCFAAFAILYSEVFVVITGINNNNMNNDNTGSFVENSTLLINYGLIIKIA